MGELVIGFLFLLLSIFTFWQTEEFLSVRRAEGGIAVFPRLVAVVMGILAVILIIRKMQVVEKEDLFINLKEVLKTHRLVIVTLYNFFLYILLMGFVGFRLSTFFFVFLTQLFIGPEIRTWKTYLIITGVALFISLGSFYFFQSYSGVRFPTGFFF